VQYRNRVTHPDVGQDVVLLAVLLQVPLDLLMGQEAAQLGLKGEVWEHHHLLGKVGPVGKRRTGVLLCTNTTL